MCEEIRWIQRLEQFGKARLRLQEVLEAMRQEPGDRLYQMDTRKLGPSGPR